MTTKSPAIVDGYIAFIYEDDLSPTGREVYVSPTIWRDRHEVLKFYRPEQIHSFLKIEQHAGRQ